MTDYLLCDTCVIIDYINGRNTTLNDLLNDGKILFINSVIEMELLQGVPHKIATLKYAIEDIKFIDTIENIYQEKPKSSTN